jgi:hypothetical protein
VLIQTSLPESPASRRTYSKSVGSGPRAFSRMPRGSLMPVKIESAAPKWPRFDVRARG